ncbi:hypothetical protein [Micromonospora sp. WMMD737]|uniref:hypothetical protein n=1 Tax=Micromonospora sp. WMMD737 TaxID=3404113 RepID=UPI003B94A9AA
MNRWEIILGIVFGLLVNEVTDISPWAARRLTRWSAYRWTTDPEMAAGYAEEWAAVIDDRPGKLLKLLTALRFALGAAGRAAPRAVVQAVRAARTFRLRRTRTAQAADDRPIVQHSEAEGRLYIAVDEWHPDLAERFKLDVAHIKPAKIGDGNWPKRMLLLPADEHAKFKPCKRRHEPRPE